MCSSEWRYEAISTVSPATRVCSAPASSGAATATVAIPSSRQVRKMRTAISPRFATRSFEVVLMSEPGGRALLEERPQTVLPFFAGPPRGGPRQQILLVAGLDD